jgi:putative hydrolase of the HAD superfamily
MVSQPAYLLFDLDETLYPASCGLMQAVSERMTAFVAEYLGLPEAKAVELRRGLSLRYGTTLTGLMREHGLADPERYLAYTHDVEVERILRHLGVQGLFERIFDIRFNGLAGKPDAAVYPRVLKTLGRRSEEVLLIDNRLDYLQAFRSLGGRVLLIAERGCCRGAPAGQPGEAPCLRDVKELPAFLGFSRR